MIEPLLLESSVGGLPTALLDWKKVLLDPSNWFVLLLWQVLRILLIVGITRLAIRLVGQISRRILTQLEPTLRKFFTQVAEVLTLIVGIVAALNVAGIEATTIVAILGTAGLAVGLALQNTLSHFAAGMMLVSFRPFEVGDAIEGAGVSGVVDSIGLFSTAIITPDNVKITVPNGNLFSNNLKNMTAMGTRRVDVQVNIGDRAIEPMMLELLALVQPHPLVLNTPKPTCHVMTLSKEGTVLSLRPWCAARVYEQVHSEIQTLVHEALQHPS